MQFALPKISTLKVIKLLINTNLFIALAAVMLTIGTQVQLGIKPSFEYYLPLIFFITVIDYNLHRIVKLLFSKSAITIEKHRWAYKNIKALYITIGIAFIGMIITLFFTELRVILWLLPFGILAVFYSMPPTIGKQKMPNIRRIPGLKIFIISITWAALTILLPVSQMEYKTTTLHVVLMMLERFFFIFAITITFDIRDMLEDYKSGVRTLPIIYGKRKSKIYAVSALLIATAISINHYMLRTDYAIALAMVVSLTSTILLLYNKKIQQSTIFYYGFLDGAIILQGLLLILAYFCPCSI